MRSRNGARSCSHFLYAAVVLILEAEPCSACGLQRSSVVSEEVGTVAAVCPGLVKEEPTVLGRHQLFFSFVCSLVKSRLREQLVAGAERGSGCSLLLECTGYLCCGLLLD